jgi:hypothetical protein
MNRCRAWSGARAFHLRDETRRSRPPGEAPVLAAARVFFLTEVTHDGFTVVDHCPCVPVWRSAPLGLSLVWLWSLGRRRGAGACPRRVAPQRPTLTGTGPGRQGAGARYGGSLVAPLPSSRAAHLTPAGGAWPGRADVTGDGPMQQGTATSARGMVPHNHPWCQHMWPSRGTKGERRWGAKPTSSKGASKRQ